MTTPRNGGELIPAEVFMSDVNPVEPEHVLFTGVDTQDPFQHWYIEHCRCGWEGNPKLSEMAAMDEGAQHIERFCL